jgi:hypothetical protein
VRVSFDTGATDSMRNGLLLLAPQGAGAAGAATAGVTGAVGASARAIAAVRADVVSRAAKRIAADLAFMLFSFLSQ